MKLSTGYIILVVFLTGCFSNQDDKTKNASDIRIENGKEHVLSNAEKLEDYILALDSSDINSVSKATSKFKELFDQKDSLQNDEGVALIVNYLDKVAMYASQNVFDDKVNYAPLLDIEFLGGKKAAPSDLAATYKALNSNGFRVRQTEGMFTLQTNPFYLQEQFYPYISNNFEIYLQQLGRENKEGYAEDAAIAIPFQSLVQRVIWWEDFANATKGSVVGQKAKEQYRDYFAALTIGMDNTPAIESEQIATYFRDAYSYLKDFAPNSRSYQRLQPYIALLEQEKIEEAKALVPGLLADDSQI